MNTVPFDQLGPGQSGRLAYQVLGQNGPIFNPQNIRYLSPDSLEIPANTMSTGTSGMFAGLAGANLISSILNPGVSVYITHRINSLHRKIDHLQKIMDRIEQKIDYIMTKVERIDMQVAENNLRQALNHTLQKAVSQEEIDLRVLASFQKDLLIFNNSLSSRLLTNFGLRLSSDVLHQLQMICDLLYGIRKLVAHIYNTSVDGDPERVIAVNPTGYFSVFGGDLEDLVKLDILFDRVVYELITHKEEMLEFAAIISEQEVSDCEDEHGDRLATLFDNTGYVCLDGCYPEGLSVLFKDEVPEAVEQVLYDLCYVWLYQTDAGLFFRTSVEIEAITSGYENTFWPQLIEAEPCGINQIDVACDVPLLENA